jgi:hypothetical protein
MLFLLVGLLQWQEISRLATMARKVFQEIATPTSTIEGERDIRPIPNNTEIVPHAQTHIFSRDSRNYLYHYFRELVSNQTLMTTFLPS